MRWSRRPANGHDQCGAVQCRRAQRHLSFDPIEASACSLTVSHRVKSENVELEQDFTTNHRSC
jgi:hypothetical protein